MADDQTPTFKYQNPDGQGRVTCGWTKQGQLYLRPEGAYPGSAAIVARDHAWELAKYIACDLPGGLAVHRNFRFQVGSHFVRRVHLYDSLGPNHLEFGPIGRAEAGGETGNSVLREFQ